MNDLAGPLTNGRMTTNVVRNDRYYNVMDNIPCRASAHLTASAAWTGSCCAVKQSICPIYPSPSLSRSPNRLPSPSDAHSSTCPICREMTPRKMLLDNLCRTLPSIQLSTREFPLLCHHYFCHRYGHQLQLAIIKGSIHSSYRRRSYFNELIPLSIVRRPLYVTDIILLVNFAKSTRRQAVLLSVYLPLTPASRI